MNKPDYKDPTLLGKMLKRIMERRTNYYVAPKGNVMVYWQGSWEEYHIVASVDKRLEV